MIELISVVIPTYKRNDLLVKCLNQLRPNKQTISNELYEVIVTDDSADCEAKGLIEEKYPWVHWVEGPHRGPAANRNNGAKVTKGEWLIFIDDDCIPDNDILITYYNEIIKGNYKGIEGYINADRPKERFDEQSPLNLTGGCFWSCNIAVEKEIFDSIGGFDVGFPFPALEDTDFYHRLKLVTKTTFLENAKVVHPWRRVQRWNNYKKWINCNDHAMKKADTPKNINYRIKRIKLFIRLLGRYGNELIKFKFKGFAFFVEVLLTNFILIFR
jgi:GT2 family glycosyltransferase